MYNIEVNAVIIVLILMLVVAFMSFKCRNKNKEFRKVNNKDNIMEEEDVRHVARQQAL